MFESLTYNKLQSECKARGLSAKGKVAELIARLNEYESNNTVVEETPVNKPLSTLQSLFANSIANNFSNVSNDLTDTANNTNEVTNEVVEQKLETKVNYVKPVTEIKSSPNANEVFKIESILVFINGGRVTDLREKQETIAYLSECVEWFTVNEPSRLISSDIPDINNINSIYIQMEQKFEYAYGKGITKTNTRIKNGKELQSLDAISPKEVQLPCWTRYKLAKKSRKASLNRNKSDFEVGMISPSGRIENVQAMNATEENKIFFNLYEHSQTKNTNSHGADGLEINKYHPEYIITSQTPVFCPHVVSVQVNGKYIISSLTKLNPDYRNDRPKPTTTNKVKSGIVANWSMPFEIQLSKGQYLADKLGTNPVQVQIAMENELLVLYTLDKSFTRSDSVKAAHRFKSFSQNLTQHRTKLLTIGTVELSETPIYIWQATQPQYEHLAKLLNKSTNLPIAVKQQYTGLTLTNTTLSIGDRVLCNKIKKGKKLVVKSELRPEYMDNHYSPKPECLWLEQLRNDITKKMLQANVNEVKKNLDKYIVNNSDKMLHRALHDVKKVQQSLRGVVRLYQPNISDSDITRLAFLMSEYVFTKLNLNKAQAVSLVKSLKTNVDEYIKLRDIVITPQLGHLREVVTPSAVYYR